MLMPALPKTVREAWGEEVAEAFVGWIDNVLGDALLGDALIAAVAAELAMEPRQLARDSLKAYLNQTLQHARVEIERLCDKYGVTSSEEMEARYKAGELPEEGTWEDFFTLDHLEAKRDKLNELLETVQWKT